MPLRCTTHLPANSTRFASTSVAPPKKGPLHTRTQLQPLHTLPREMLCIRGQAQYKTNSLSDPIDVFSQWIDHAEELNKAAAAAAGVDEASVVAAAKKAKAKKAGGASTPLRSRFS